MLRAIAGYFFGGVQEEAPEPSLECETKEVNDWLVVNMADHPQDEIDLDDVVELDMAELDDDEDADDILNAVSFLMRTDELQESGGSFSDEDSEDETDSLAWSKSDASFSLRGIDDPFSVGSNNEYFPEDNSILLRDPLSLINMGFYVTPKDVIRSEIVQSFQCDELGYFVAQPDFPALRLQMRTGHSKNNLRLHSGIQLLNYKNDVKVIRQSDALAVHKFPKDTSAIVETPVTSTQKYSAPKIKELMQKMKERNLMKNRVADVTCHPIDSKTYINHRHPAMPPKTDLMKKIKELEPEQKARENVIKKYITRGQLNRQNKNYIYDTSNKRNRRKDLQRQPSGANNNRRC